MECDERKRVQAYHDGELAPEQMSQFERHLRACAECLMELEVLRRLSHAVGEMEIPRLSAEAVARMKERVKRAAERGVLRLAEWLTAVAAAVLLAGIIGMPRASETGGPGERIVSVNPVVDQTWQKVALDQAAEPEIASADPISDLMELDTSRNK